MKLLLTHRYFWPDSAPYAAMLRTLADSFANHGHEVHIFTSIPSYRESISAPAYETCGKLTVRRTWVFREDRANPLIRGLNLLIYSVRLFLHVLRVRPDVVSASTFPPVAAAWFASLAARITGARFVYHMQDIHPEVSKFSGGRLGRGVVGRLLTWLDNQTLRRASAVVVLSEDMANTLRARGIAGLPLHVINNFLLDNFGVSAAPPADLRKPAGKRRVIFAGNLGRFQNLPLLAEGVATCFRSFPDLELFFLGDGALLPELKARWTGNDQVRFAPFLPFSEARQLIAESDVGLVSLSPDIYRVSYPSKVLTYLGLGVPVLAVVEPNSMVARDIRDVGLGAVPDSNSPEDIGQALASLLDGPNLTSVIRSWYSVNATREAAVRKWLQVIGSMAAAY
jgi:glycosyltransferase involved in cell wall biosynthesis